MTKSEDQIREIAKDAIHGLIEESTEAGIIGWLDTRYDYLTRDDVNRVFDALYDAKVSVQW